MLLIIYKGIHHVAMWCYPGASDVDTSESVPFLKSGLCDSLTEDFKYFVRRSTDTTPVTPLVNPVNPAPMSVNGILGNSYERLKLKSVEQLRTLVRTLFKRIATEEGGNMR
jgi:hypothetical protein